MESQTPNIIEVCEGGKVRDVYQRIKEYYQELVEKQKVNEYR